MHPATSMPRCRHQWQNLLRAGLLGVALVAAPWLAQAREVEEVVVVGSRSAPRTAAETSVPVDVITAARIARTGITETARLIQTLVPSYNFSVSTISDGTDAVRPATLRGLYPDQLLVLVNGKRRHNSALVHVNGSVGRGSAGVDLNAIPPSAIKRIEVLRDSAAAQYGSDAIAGIINIVLKDQTDSTELQTYYGETYQGDGEQRRHSLNTGWQIGEEGFLNLSIERRSRNRTDRAGDDPRCQYDNIGGLYPADCNNSRETAFDRHNHGFGDADSKNEYVFFNAQTPLHGGFTFYAFGGLAQRDTSAPGFYRRAGDPRNDRDPRTPGVQPFYPDGFLPFIHTDVDDGSLAFGVRGRIGAWDTDTSISYGENTFEFSVRNSHNVHLGEDSPTSAAAGELVFSQATFNLDALREVDWGWPAPVGLAAGYEYRRDEYEIKAGEPASYCCDDPELIGLLAAPGIQVFPGFQPRNEVNRSRHNHAFYVDAETWLSESLRFGAAARYEDYSDFGSDLNGKLSARYEFSDNFALRGALSTGFRAPGLGQQHLNNISTQFQTDPDGSICGSPGCAYATETVTAPNNSALTRALGVEQLREETSVNFSLGFVFQPLDNLTLSADAYRVRIDDRIVLSSQLGVDDVAPGRADEIRGILRREYGTERVNFQFFTNAVDTKTRGLDLIADYLFSFDYGATLNLTGALNFNSTDIDGDIDQPTELDADADVFKQREVDYVEVGQPRQSYRFSGYYSHDVHDLTVRLNHYGSVASSQDAVRQHYGARWLVDLEYTRHFGSSVEWTLGANNLFDTRPERSLFANSFRGIFPYNRRIAPFGYNGGFYFTNLKLRF